MSTIPKSPLYPVFKTHLDFFSEAIEYFELPDIFAHVDEQVCARILYLLWKHKDIYSNIIPLMERFLQLHIFQRILFKRYGCLNFQDWFVDDGKIAAGLE